MFLIIYHTVPFYNLCNHIPNNKTHLKQPVYFQYPYIPVAARYFKNRLLVKRKNKFINNKIN